MLGKNEKLDQPVEIFNMVDFNDVNELINVFLNDLVHSSDSLFRLEYTKKEFVFFFELLKYSFVCCTNYYDSDDHAQPGSERKIRRTWDKGHDRALQL